MFPWRVRFQHLLDPTAMAVPGRPRRARWPSGDQAATQMGDQREIQSECIVQRIVQLDAAGKGFGEEFDIVWR